MSKKLCPVEDSCRNIRFYWLYFKLMSLPPLQSETVRKLIEKTTKKKDEEKVCTCTENYTVKESVDFYTTLY